MGWGGAGIVDSAEGHHVKFFHAAGVEHKFTFIRHYGIWSI